MVQLVRRRQDEHRRGSEPCRERGKRVPRSRLGEKRLDATLGRSLAEGNGDERELFCGGMLGRALDGEDGRRNGDAISHDLASLLITGLLGGDVDLADEPLRNRAKVQRGEHAHEAGDERITPPDVGMLMRQYDGTFIPGQRFEEAARQENPRAEESGSETERLRRLDDGHAEIATTLTGHREHAENAARPRHAGRGERRAQERIANDDAEQQQDDTVHSYLRQMQKAEMRMPVVVGGTVVESGELQRHKRWKGRREHQRARCEHRQRGKQDERAVSCARLPASDAVTDDAYGDG